MAESISDQVIDAIVASLTAISGDSGTTYWETPGAVIAVDFPLETLLDPSISGPIYAVQAGAEEHVEGETGTVVGAVEVELPLTIFCLQSFPDDLLPFRQRDPRRGKVVNRMVRDVLRKLLVDVQLLSVGGAVENVFAKPVIVDRDIYLPNWAAAEIHFRVSYIYRNGTP